MKKILCVLALTIFVASNAHAAPAASGSASGAVGLSVTALAAPTEGDKPLKVTTAGEIGAYSELSLSLQENNIFIGLGTGKGDATTQIAVTDIGGDVWRYTWTGTGTDPVFGCQPGETPAGTLLNIQAQNLDAGDNGVVTVTSCGNDAVDGHDWFQVSNASGVASTGTIGTGSIKVDLAAASPLDTDLSSVSAADDTVASAKATKAMGDLKLLKVTKFTQCITVKDPVATSDHQAWRAPQAITITNMHCLATGGTSLTGQFQEGDANGANMADVDSDMTCTAGSNVNDDGALSNPSIDAGDYIYWKTTSVSGTQTELIACFDFTYN